MNGRYGKKATQGCPCGHLGDPRQDCRCAGEQIRRYRARISGPLMDRIDLHLEVPPVQPEVLAAGNGLNTTRSHDVRQRVIAAQAHQLDRQGCLNAELGPEAIDHYCRLTEKDTGLLQQAMTTLKLSARAYHRILRVARTIADLSGSELIRSLHLTEALSYRALDRKV